MSVYLRNNKLMSYYGGGYRIFAIIGGRGRGKTYSAKKYIMDNFFYKKKKFVWIRATESMCKQLKEFDGHAFMEDVIENKEYKFPFDVIIDGDNTIFVRRTKIDENGKKVVTDSHCGYLMSLSTFYNRKGNSYQDADIIVFDEFIAESDEVMRGDRARQFVNTIQTILRLKEHAIIILLANALSKSDPILNLFVKKIKGHGYYFNKSKKFVLWYMEDSDAFIEANDKSIAGLIVKGTAYEEQIVSNKFISYDSLYFDKLPPSAMFLGRLEVDRVYKVNLYINNKIYITSVKNPNAKRVYCRDVDSKTENARVISTSFLNRLRLLYSANQVLFEDETTRKIFVDFIK